MTTFEVGKPFTLYKKSNINHADGAVLEVTEEGQYFLCIYLKNVLPQEIDAVNKGKLQFRTFEDNSIGFVLTLLSVGKALTFEIIFDPTLYKNRRADIELYKKSNLLNICVIDNGILKCMRLISIPDKLHQRWINSWSKMLKIKYCNEQYMNWIFSLYRFNISQLWDYSIEAGKIEKRQS